MLQYVTVCCSVLQCLVTCCSVLQCVAVGCRVLWCVMVCRSALPHVAVCCHMLQCVAVGSPAAASLRCADSPEAGQRSATYIHANKPVCTCMHAYIQIYTHTCIHAPYMHANARKMHTHKILRFENSRLTHTKLHSDFY